MGLFFKSVFLTLFLFIVTLSVKSSQLYNVLFIVSDDLRPEIGGPYGQNDNIYTPNLEALMDKSLTFTHAYVQISLCSPSRTSFLTGLRPDTTRIWHIGPYFRETMLNNAGPNVTTLPQYFKEYGNYYTIGAGKIFHPGSSSGGIGVEGGADMPYSWSEPYWFCNHFFNGTFQSTAMQNYPNGTGCIQDYNCISCLSEYNCYSQTGHPSRGSAPCDNKCFPEGAISDKILSYFEYFNSNNYDKSIPFFLAVGFKRPHEAWYAPSKYFEYYPNGSATIATHTDLPINAPVWASNNGSGIKNVDDVQPYIYYFNYTWDNSSYTLQQVKDSYHTYLKEGYYTTVTYMDSQLGRIMNGLYKYNLWDNTIIVFFGDHGFHLGEQGQWAKFTNFELGARIPLIIRHPKITSSHGKSSDVLVEALDIFPTLIELSGIGYNNSSNIKSQLEGKSLVELFYDQNNPSFPQYAYNQFTRNGTNIMGCSIRTTQWRYTEWVKFIEGNATTNTPDIIDWNTLYGIELYNHSNITGAINDLNGYENYNYGYDSNYNSTVKQMHQLLVSTWDNQTWNIS